MEVQPEARVEVCYNGGWMSDPVIVARADHPISRSSHRSRRAEGAHPPARRSTTPRIWSAAACAICCSAGGPRTSTSAPRRTRTRSRSCSGTAGSSAAASASPTSSSATRRSKWRRSASTSRPCRPSRRSTRPSCERDGAGEPVRDVESRDLQIHRDNTFGTPEEDAFRRDFTDQRAVLQHRRSSRSSTTSAGSSDIRDRVIRSIGDPNAALPGRPGPDAARGGAGGAARLLARSAGRRRPSRRSGTGWPWPRRRG